MKRLALAVLVLAVGSALGAPAPFPKAERPERRTDLQRMQGEWVMVAKHYHHEGGRCVKQDTSGSGYWQLIEGDRIRWYGPWGDVYIGEKILLHPGAGPKGIDLVSERSGEVERGLYRLKGDTLTIVTSAAGKGRPTPDGDGFRGWDSVTVLRRKKP